MALEWEKPIQTFERSPEDKRVEAVYRFRNTGSATVNIKSVRSSCGCTAANLDRKTYAPGEAGEVTARFVFGSRTGGQRKTISITTDEPGAGPTVLELRVQIAQALEVRPALVFWRTGETPAPKAVQLVAGGRPVKVRSVLSSSPRISARLETVEPGASYTVIVQPADTAGRESAEVTVQTDFPPDAPRAYTIHARIK